MTSATAEQVYYDALKRISLYRSPEWLRKNGEREYGLSGEEAIEYAYENVLCEARVAISRKRRPKGVEKQFQGTATGSAIKQEHRST